jgi:FkbM family methyltransferase
MLHVIKRHLKRLAPKPVVGWLAYHCSQKKSTFSQFAEDLVLARLLPEPRGLYVDVGAFHPKFGSNTYFLWKRGWRGINIDVDDYKIALFRRFRPNDINLTTGVSSENGERTFYVQQGESYGSMSSFNQDFALSRSLRSNRRLGSRTVPVRTLTSLLEEFLPRSADGVRTPIDFLNIDVEGHEHEILRTLDFSQFRPRCLCVEIHAHAFDDLAKTATYELLRSHGYQLVAWPAPSCIFTTLDSLESSIQRREPDHAVALRQIA